MCRLRGLYFFHVLEIGTKRRHPCTHDRVAVVVVVVASFFGSSSHDPVCITYARAVSSEASFAFLGGTPPPPPPPRLPPAPLPTMSVMVPRPHGALRAEVGRVSGYVTVVGGMVISGVLLRSCCLRVAERDVQCCVPYPNTKSGAQSGEGTSRREMLQWLVAPRTLIVLVEALRCVRKGCLNLERAACALSRKVDSIAGGSAALPVVASCFEHC